MLIQEKVRVGCIFNLKNSTTIFCNFDIFCLVDLPKSGRRATRTWAGGAAQKRAAAGPQPGPLSAKNFLQVPTRDGGGEHRRQQPRGHHHAGGDAGRGARWHWRWRRRRRRRQRLGERVQHAAGIGAGGPLSGGGDVCDGDAGAGAVARRHSVGPSAGQRQQRRRVVGQRGSGAQHQRAGATGAAVRLGQQGVPDAAAARLSAPGHHRRDRRGRGDAKCRCFQGGVAAQGGEQRQRHPPLQRAETVRNVDDDGQRCGADPGADASSGYNCGTDRGTAARSWTATAAGFHRWLQGAFEICLLN